MNVVWIGLKVDFSIQNSCLNSTFLSQKVDFVEMEMAADLDAQQGDDDGDDYDGFI